LKPTFSNRKHIFFDLDDTLYDFQKNSILALTRLYDEYDLTSKLKVNLDEFFQVYKKVNREFWRKYDQGEISKEYLRDYRFHTAFQQFSYDNFEDSLSFNTQYLTLAPQGGHLKEGCLELLDYLKGKYRLHIITNGFKEIQHVKIARCGIGHYFHNIIVSEEHNVWKPNEKIFRLSETLAGCCKDDCVMIGDSYESDITGAMNAGWHAIWITDEESERPVHKIRSLNELRGIL
jgi:putative hydrolase of the HAD superfamily